MDSAIISALIAAMTALAVVFAENWRQRRQAEADRLDAAQQILRRYRQPLVRAAFDLQSRLHNLVHGDILWYLRRAEAGETVDEDRARYVVVNTCFVVADYLGWVEIIRQEIQAIGSVERETHDLEACMEAVSDAFAGHDAGQDESFSIWRGDQRAIGELMLVPAGDGSPLSQRCMGYASFSDRFGDESFARWFVRLDQDLRAFARDAAEPGRLVRLQEALVRLISTLEPGFLASKGVPEPVQRRRAANVPPPRATTVVPEELD